MKQARLILLFILVFPAWAAADEIGQKDGLVVQWQRALEENKIPGLPALFVSKVNSNWIGFGFFLNSPESFKENSPLRFLMRQLPLFQAAVMLQGKTISSSIILSYEKEHAWGLSAKLSF